MGKCLVHKLKSQKISLLSLVCNKRHKPTSYSSSHSPNVYSLLKRFNHFSRKIAHLLTIQGYKSHYSFLPGSDPTKGVFFTWWKMLDLALPTDHTRLDRVRSSFSFIYSLTFYKIYIKCLHIL